MHDKLDGLDRTIGRRNLDLMTVYLALQDGFWVPGREEALAALERIGRELRGLEV